jgi:hypothetical protein
MMGNQEILFASLVGSKLVKIVPRLEAVENELSKHVLPAVPFLPFKNKDSVGGYSHAATEYGSPGLWEADKPTDEEKQFFPLKLSIDEGRSWFLLPYEPMINIGGKNIVVMRNVAKWNNDKNRQLIGSIKERWAQGDYDISITGVLMGSLLAGNVEDCFPRSDFEKLRKVLTNAKEVLVQCPPLELLGINKIVILDFVFPFTKGENVQAYDIKAVSDDSYKLLLDV